MKTIKFKNWVYETRIKIRNRQYSYYSAVIERMVMEAMERRAYENSKTRTEV